MVALAAMGAPAIASFQRRPRCDPGALATAPAFSLRRKDRRRASGGDSDTRRSPIAPCRRCRAEPGGSARKFRTAGSGLPIGSSMDRSCSCSALTSARVGRAAGATGFHRRSHFPVSQRAGCRSDNRRADSPLTLLRRMRPSNDVPWLGTRIRSKFPAFGGSAAGDRWAVEQTTFVNSVSGLVQQAG